MTPKNAESRFINTERQTGIKLGVDCVFEIFKPEFEPVHPILENRLLFLACPNPIGETGERVGRSVSQSIDQVLDPQFGILGESGFYLGLPLRRPNRVGYSCIGELNADHVGPSAANLIPIRGSWIFCEACVLALLPRR